MKTLTLQVIGLLVLLIIFYGCAIVGQQDYLNMTPKVDYKYDFGSIGRPIPSITFSTKNECDTTILEIGFEISTIKTHEYLYGPAFAPVFPIPFFYGAKKGDDTLWVRVTIKSAIHHSIMVFKDYDVMYLKNKFNPILKLKMDSESIVYPIKTKIDKNDGWIIYLNYWFDVQPSAIDEAEFLLETNACHFQDVIKINLLNKRRWFYYLFI